MNVKPSRQGAPELTFDLRMLMLGRVLWRIVRERNLDGPSLLRSDDRPQPSGEDGSPSARAAEGDRSARRRDPDHTCHAMQE
jgi:hypothetical protein